jgi:hypothetical protein
VIDPVMTGPDIDLAAVDPDLVEVADADAHNAIEDRPDPRPPPVVRGPAGPDWHPSSGDQRDAHKAIGALGDPERQIFLEQWDIETFSEVWPAPAVADALGIEQDTGG